MKKALTVCATVAFLGIALLSLRSSLDRLETRIRQLENNLGGKPAGTSLPFPLAYTAADTLVLGETGAGDPQPDPTIWINSGALFYLEEGIGRTIFGELPKYSRWRIIYAISNPRDTDSGYHPQNIFRLIVTKKIADVETQTYFRVKKDNLSDSPYRNASNGVFLMHRYVDSDNLYYYGLRVDGAAVVKKKKKGTYETLAYKPLFEGSAYDRAENPNLLPKDAWLGLRAETRTLPDGSVLLRFFVDTEGEGTWQLVFTLRDTGKNRPALAEAGFSGLRSDFMDIEFKEFKVTSL